MDAVIEKDEKGKFVKGNRGGRGRPLGTDMRDLRVLAKRVIKATQLRQLVENASEEALKGDWRAREWLTKLLLDTK